MCESRAEAVLGGCALSNVAYDSSSSKCTAVAMGQSDQAYTVEVHLDQSLSSECSCPADKTRSPCKHAVGLALHAFRARVHLPRNNGEHPISYSQSSMIAWILQPSASHMFSRLLRLLERS